MKVKENRIENLDEAGYRSLGKTLQDPVRDTVRTWCLAELETIKGFLNLFRTINWVRWQVYGSKTSAPCQLAP